MALFTFGINTSLRASDLLRIRRDQVVDLKPGDNFELIEKKTCKRRRITLNKSCVEAIQALLTSKDFKTDYLFEPKRGINSILYVFTYRIDTLIIQH